MAEIYAVIMAGGRGERFWPLSTASLPKPFMRLTGEQTLFQETVSRLLPLIPEKRIFVCLGKDHLGIARQQAPRIALENFIVEPVGRDTAACLGLCALHLEQRDPDSLMLALPADHFVTDPGAFRLSLQKGFDSLAGSTGVVFGIAPSRADTGYGYILAENPALAADAWQVLRFVEKPDAETAAIYVASGRYFWNSGMFLWENRTLLELFNRHMPETFAGLNAMRPLIGRDDAGEQLHNIFSTLQRISIDFGILEKLSGLRMIPLRFGWDDVGNWNSLERVLRGDSSENIALGPHLLRESHHCITFSDAGPIAAFGVSDLIIVQARGRVLVCHKSMSRDLKKLVTALDPEWK